MIAQGESLVTRLEYGKKRRPYCLQTLEEAPLKTFFGSTLREIEGESSFFLFRDRNRL